VAESLRRTSNQRVDYLKEEIQCDWNDPCAETSSIVPLASRLNSATVTVEHTAQVSADLISLCSAATVSLDFASV